MAPEIVVHRSEPFEAKVLAILEQEAAKFSSARVDVRREEGPVIFTLACDAGDTASVAVLPDPSQVDVFIGSGLHLELVSDESTQLTYLGEVVMAVTGGRYEEAVHVFRGKPVRVEGFVRDGLATRRLGDTGTLLGTLRLVPRRRVAYAPYK